jgi:D-erythro-7,8-dihydroneopterin triphosphate epimerase
MVTIRIKNLRLRTYIGFNDDERRKRQDVVINVVFSYKADEAAETDDVKYAVNYRTITKEVIHLVEEGRFMLLERLAADVLELVMENPLIARAEVEVDKPHALRFSDSVSASVRAQRSGSIHA